MEIGTGPSCLTIQNDHCFQFAKRAEQNKLTAMPGKNSGEADVQLIHSFRQSLKVLFFLFHHFHFYLMKFRESGRDFHKILYKIIIQTFI